MGCPPRAFDRSLDAGGRRRVLALAALAGLSFMPVCDLLASRLVPAAAALLALAGVLAFILSGVLLFGLVLVDLVTVRRAALATAPDMRSPQ